MARCAEERCTRKLLVDSGRVDSVILTDVRHAAPAESRLYVSDAQPTM